MSRHWKPPSEKIVRIRPVGGKRLRSLDEFVNPDFVGRWRLIASGKGGQLPEGAKAGLLLIAAACVGIAIGAYQVLGPRDVVADEVAAMHLAKSAQR
ncbi:MAG: hypothetical protein ACTHN4_03995 [Sphingomicrobium sp.]